jgi:predicted MFS family arabinose efflux permease
VDVAAPETGSSRLAGGLLRNRNFRLLWFGETINSLGGAMAGVGVPLLAVEYLHASTLAVSALTAAEYLPWLIVGLPAGAWVDRLPPRLLMITCDLASAVLFVSLPVAAWLHLLTVAQVLVVALLAGAAEVFFATSYTVYLPVLVPKDDLLEGNTKLSASQSVASISGSGVAGLVAQAIGDASALLFNAGSFLVSAVCLFVIKAPASSRTGPKRTSTIRADIAEGLRFIWRDPLLRVLAIFPTVSNFAYGGVLAISVVFLIRVVRIDQAEVGFLLAVGGVGGVVGPLIARRVAIRAGTARTLLLLVLASGLAGLLIPLTALGPRTAFYVVGSGIVVAAISGSSVIMVSFRQVYCPPEILGRATAGQRFLTFGIAPFGALAAGALGTEIGVRAALWIMLVLFALSGTLLLTRQILGNRDLPKEARTVQAKEPPVRSST